MSPRCAQDLIAIVSGLRKRGVGFTSLHEALDTTTPGGRLVFHVFLPAPRLRKRSRLSGLNRLSGSGQLTASAEEHIELLDLVVAGDAGGAESCMLGHMSHVHPLWADSRRGEPAGRA
ncbi:hypothetical protein ACLQ2N_06445 [Streptomyces sp. DT224]|uniref:hypothetical protein n=1 Tax=Streptomyces sp. DT224 TaxID=3393426 RepID=UPI003CFA0D4D